MNDHSGFKALTKINMNSKEIESLPAPVADNDAVRKVYIQDTVDKKHTQGTDTALGAQAENLDMNTHKIVGVVDPTADQEAATKKYIDNLLEIHSARAYLNTANQVIPTNTTTIVEFDAENWDVQEEFDIAGDHDFIAKKGGKYQINSQLYFANAGDGTVIQIIVKVNATEITKQMKEVHSATEDPYILISDILNLSISDVVTISTYQNSGGNIILQKGSKHTYFAIEKLSD